jgi:hypothetical protein
LTRKIKFIIAALFTTGLLFILPSNRAHADNIPNASEQVIVSPAQQAVNTALSTATIEVAQAVAASDTATVTTVNAVRAVTTSNTAVAAANTAITTAVAAVAEVANIVPIVETATVVTQNVTTAVTSATTTVAAIPASATTLSPEVSIAQQAVTAAMSTISEAATTLVQAVVELTTPTTTTISVPEVTVAQVANHVASEITQSETATAAIQTAQTAVDTATTTISNANKAISAISTSRTEAQAQLTQANIAINNAQDAVNALSATIGASTNVLANTDDAGVRMNLPFNLRMGNTIYNNVYVGSNGTITFGVNEGQNYYSTPNAPSISVAGYDWTTWSSGSGVTYSTTTNTLTVAWDVRPYPQFTADTQMTQIRFNADVNPSDGAWAADVSVTGPIPNGARFNIRPTTNGTIIPIVDTNPGPGFNGVVAQGAPFVPIPNPSTAAVQAAVETANAQIATLNSTITTVVAANTVNANTVIAPIATVSHNAIISLNNANTELNNKIAALEIMSTAVEKVLTAPAIIQEAQTFISSIPMPPPQPAPAPEPAPEVAPEPALEVAPEPAPEVAPEPAPEVAPEPAPEVAPEPAPEVAPEPAPEVAPEPAPEVAPEPAPEVAPEPTPAPEPPAVIEVTKDTTAETWKPAVAPEEYLTKAEIKSYEAIGLVPNNPAQLPTDIPKPAPAEILVPHEQIDVKGVENGGIQFFGTQNAPQVVGEDGNLTPPAPPPGSGLPIPPDAITTIDTFIGQPGGTTFNSPDIAVPVILVPLDGAIASIPGAEALNQAFVAMANIGNDMSPVTRKKAKKILVLTIAVTAIRRRFN